MKKSGLFLAMVLFTTTVVQSALGQGGFQEWSATKSGKGVFQFAGQRDAGLYRATINLRRGGEAEIQLFGARTYTFTGQWSGNRFSGVDLVITSANGRPGDNGKGRMTFRRNGDLERFNFTGSGIRATYSVTFDATPGGGGGNNPSQEFVGVYRSVVQVREGREDYTLVRILRIKEDKTVELVSRFKGTEPQVNRNSIRRHGDLLQEIRDRKTIIHTGTWNVVGRRLEIYLTTLNGGREESRMTFELSNGNLNTIDWDKQTYGSEGFNFVRDESADDEDTNQPPVQPPPVQPPPVVDRSVGRYTALLQTPDTKGLVERTLELRADGRGSFSQRWSGISRPRFSTRDVAELGQVIVELEDRNGPVVHSGTWQEGGNNFLTFNFDRTFGARNPGAIVFEVRRDGLVPMQYDEKQFGNKQFLLSRTGGTAPGTPVPNDQDANPRSLVGHYATNLRVPETTGDIERRLELDANGSARLTTEWLGSGQPQFGFRAARELGSLIRIIERTRQPVNQFGRWSFNNNQLTVRLTNTSSSGNNNRLEVNETTLIFSVQGTTLEATSFDQDIYGTRAFNLYNRQRR